MVDKSNRKIYACLLTHCQGSDKASQWLNKVHYHRRAKKLKSGLFKFTFFVRQNIYRDSQCGRQTTCSIRILIYKIYFWTLIKCQWQEYFKPVNLTRFYFKKKQIPSSFSLLRMQSNVLLVTQFESKRSSTQMSLLTCWRHKYWHKFLNKLELKTTEEDEEKWRAWERDWIRKSRRFLRVLQFPESTNF